MFKNNSYFQQACNYSFRQQSEDNKENDSSLSNYIKKDNENTVMAKLQTIQKMMMKQYQLQKQNRQMLKHQGQSITKIEKQIMKINKILTGSNEPIQNSRMKSESMKSCRNKKSADKSSLNCIQERKKVINQELSRRINDQLESRVQKKPLKFFLPVEHSIL